MGNILKLVNETRSEDSTFFWVDLLEKYYFS